MNQFLLPAAAEWFRGLRPGTRIATRGRMLARLAVTVLLLGAVAPEASAARQLGVSYARARREGRARAASGTVRSRSASRARPRGLAASRRVSSRGVSRGGTRLTFPRGAPSITGRVTFDGATTGTFVVDTGATSVALSSDFARRLGLDLRRAQRVTVMTASGPETAYAMRVGHIELGGAVAEDVPVVVMDSLNGQGSDGLLGMSFLSRFVMHLDAHAGVLELQAP